MQTLVQPVAIIFQYMKGSSYASLRLTTVYPKHEFNADDMVKTLRELGLVPNASIIVSPVSHVPLFFVLNTSL